MKQESCGNGGAVEKWKTKSGFPTFPPPSLGLEQKTKTADWRRRRKGDTSIEVRKGTFLTRLDSAISVFKSKKEKQRENN
jgi:hypothetical protein